MGLIDLYAVTLEESPTVSGILDAGGRASRSKEGKDSIDRCFAVCRSQRGTRPGTLQRWCCGRNPQRTQ